MSEFDNATAPPPPPAAGEPTAEAKQLAMFAHLSALAGIVLCGVGTIVSFWAGPLIFWLVNKDQPDRAFVVDQAKETLNFGISVFLLGVVLAILGHIPFLGLLFRLVSLLLGLAWLVLVILAAIKAKDGAAYRYPFALRLIK
jgi:uncharacterized Tic20 family protein